MTRSTACASCGAWAGFPGSQVVIHDDTVGVVQDDLGPLTPHSQQLPKAILSDRPGMRAVIAAAAGNRPDEVAWGHRAARSGQQSPGSRPATGPGRREPGRHPSSPHRSPPSSPAHRRPPLSRLDLGSTQRPAGVDQHLLPHRRPPAPPRSASSAVIRCTTACVSSRPCRGRIRSFAAMPWARFPARPGPVPHVRAHRTTRGLDPLPRHRDPLHRLRQQPRIGRVRHVRRDNRGVRW